MFRILNLFKKKKGVKEKTKKKVALELIKEGTPSDLIAKVTHLDKDEIEQLKNKLDE